MLEIPTTRRNQVHNFLVLEQLVSIIASISRHFQRIRTLLSSHCFEVLLV